MASEEMGDDAWSIGCRAYAFSRHRLRRTAEAGHYPWLKVLDDADVSYALPITALSYVSVAAVSALWLHEAVTGGRIFGTLLILGGVFLVSRTDHNTLPAR
jgi:drug/metabolite transporter (DMT)-like permease